MKKVAAAKLNEQTQAKSLVHMYMYIHNWYIRVHFDYRSDQ